MKEVKILSIITALFLLSTIFLTGCKTNNINSAPSETQGIIEDNSSMMQETSTVSSEASETVYENSSSSTDDASNAQTAPSSQSVVPSSSTAVPTSSAAMSSQPTPSVSQPPANPEPTLPPFTVNDPENTRGLDNKTIGCYFGISKNDQPNQMSIDNQKRFDEYNNIQALALDTVSTDKGMYLTFDCGYEYNNLTAVILDTLKEKNVKAIFFCTLSYLKRNPGLVRRMINEGHAVGNHSATHPDFTTISRTKMAEELYLFDKYLTENFGLKSTYFRFPSGNHSENALELVTSQGYKSIFWSVAYKDWETANQPNPETAFQTVTSSYHPGAVILLHAVSKTNSEILGRLIDNAHQRGYRFKSLDEYYK